MRIFEWFLNSVVFVEKTTNKLKSVLVSRWNEENKRTTIYLLMHILHPRVLKKLAWLLMSGSYFFRCCFKVTTPGVLPKWHNLSKPIPWNEYFSILSPNLACKKQPCIQSTNHDTQLQHLHKFHPYQNTKLVYKLPNKKIPSPILKYLSRYKYRYFLKSIWIHTQVCYSALPWSMERRTFNSYSQLNR